MTLPGSGLSPNGGLHVAAFTRQRLHQLGQSEVDDLGVTVFGHHDVGRLEVAVDDALVVCAGKTFGDLGSELQGPGERQLFPVNDVLELLAPDELHGDEGHAVGFVDLVNDRRCGGGRASPRPWLPG